MAIGDIIVGIDIGTSKVCTVVGEVNNFGQIETLCSTSCKCNGIKKGKIINEEEVFSFLDNLDININNAFLLRSHSKTLKR